jgi:Plasmid pRiA4b ORF-3-like protein
MANAKPISIESVKRRAKAAAKADGLKHTEGLDRAARDAGFASFRQMLTQNSVASQHDKYVVLNITLNDVNLVITRRIEIEADLSLSLAAEAIILAMGWVNAHLHSFTIPGLGIYSDDETCEELAHLDYKDANDVSLRDLVQLGKTEFSFEYDFGDGWEHHVKIDASQNARKGPNGINLISAQGLCPPEDCGGSSRFNLILEAYAAAQHESIASKLPEERLIELRECQDEIESWIGDQYNPYLAPDVKRLQDMLSFYAKYDYHFHDFILKTKWNDNENPHGYNANIHY